MLMKLDYFIVPCLSIRINSKMKTQKVVLCCASISGKKQKLLVIGKRKNPCCFKSVKCLPAVYYANTNFWMTSVIFNEWLIKRRFYYCL
jgi:hypothetical protein